MVFENLATISGARMLTISTLILCANKSSSAPRSRWKKRKIYIARCYLKEKIVEMKGREYISIVCYLFIPPYLYLFIYIIYFHLVLFSFIPTCVCVYFRGASFLRITI